MRNKKDYRIIDPIAAANQERFSNYHCYYLFWVAVGYYLWKKILTITGYRFHPTDFELLHFYLHNKNLGRDSLVQAIAEVEDICGFEPWQLPGRSNIHSGDQVWYFFYRPCFKYRNSSRINRTTNEGYWKPTGKPRKVMTRNLETEIGKKRTLVFYKGRVCDSKKIKTGWIMHEYELNATLPNQTSFVLCKLKRKFGEVDVSCIEDCQSSQYLPPNLGDYIANNANQAEAARCLTDKSDPNEMLAQLKVLDDDDHEGLDRELEHQSIELWKSYLVGGCPEKDGSGDLPLGNHVAENDITIEQEQPQDQSGTNEQDGNLGNLVPDDERSNQRNSVVDNDGSIVPSSSKNDDTTQDSIQMDLSKLGGPSTDELFAELEALPEVNRFVDQENRFEQMIDDDWIYGEQEISNAFENQSCTNEDHNLTATGMICSPHAINLSRKRLRTDYEGFGFDMKSY